MSRELARVAVGFAGGLPGGSAALGTPTRAYRIEVSGAVIETAVYVLPDRVVIPLNARLPNGGFARGAVEVDRATFERAASLAERHGAALRLSSLTEQFTGARPTVTDLRPLLARNVGGGDW